MPLNIGDRVQYYNPNDDPKIPPQPGDWGDIVEFVPHSPFARVRWDYYGELLIHVKWLRK